MASVQGCLSREEMNWWLCELWALVCTLLGGGGLLVLRLQTSKVNRISLGFSVEMERVWICVSEVNYSL